MINSIGLKADLLSESKRDLARKDAPSIHEDFQMGAKVVVDKSAHPDGLQGEIIGIATKHVFFTYIVLLDHPLTMDDGLAHKAITMPGMLLRHAETE